MRFVCMTAGFLAAAALLTGCPRMGAPIFDTTGDYAGVWSGNVVGESADKVANVQITDCPLSMTLEQNFDGRFPENRFVRGEVTIDYGCLELPNGIDASVAPSTVEVSGILSESGKLRLLSGDCGPGFCVVLILDGEGVDENEDSFMDRYAGDWTFTILLAGIAPFSVDGTFEVEVVESEE